MASAVLEPLRAAIEKSKTVKGSAKILIDGFKKRLEDAKAEALVNGATEAELAPFTALSDDMNAGSAELQAAVEANTPAAP